METRKSIGEEYGADLMLLGVINIITDRSSTTKLKFYQVDLELIELSTNQKVWLGTKKIKKIVTGKQNPSSRLSTYNKNTPKRFFEAQADIEHNFKVGSFSHKPKKHIDINHYNITSDDKQYIYKKYKKSKYIYLFSVYPIPTLGNFLLGDWLKGILFAGTIGLGVTGLEIDNNYNLQRKHTIALRTTSFALITTGWIGSILTAYYYTKDYNKGLFQALYPSLNAYSNTSLRDVTINYRLSYNFK